MTDNLNISLIQAEIVWENPQANRNHFGKLIEETDSGVDLIVLPEMFTTGFSMNASKIAEEYNDSMETINWMRENARRKNACICGSIAVSEGGLYYNRLIWVNPDGLVFNYNKRHLFSFAGEDKHYTAGTNRMTVEWKGWKICPLICYDLRFPVWSRNFVKGGEAGYDLLLYVANWPEVRKAPWEKLLYARAIENQCYLAAVNRVGIDGNSHSYSGNSMILDARGDIMESAKHGEQKVISASLSFEELSKYRKIFPVLNDADAYTM